MHAFNAADGKEVRKFELVPLEGQGSDTWPPNDLENPRTGGATWTSYTIDPAAGLLYIPVGNAAPDFDIKARPGLNLYTDSVVILDAKTGVFKEYYQVTPNDFHDWDLAATPSLIKTAAGKNLIIAAGKDHERFVNYEAIGRDALLSVPTPDHYLPLLYVLATKSEGDEVSFPVEGFDGGSISMTTVRIG